MFENPGGGHTFPLPTPMVMHCVIATAAILYTYISQVCMEAKPS